MLEVALFPTALESITAPLEVSPPLRSTREGRRLTERLRGEPRRCGRSGGLSYKSRDPTVRRARLSQSPQTGAASVSLPPQLGQILSASPEGTL